MFCLKKQLSPLQRRFLQLFASGLCITAGLSYFDRPSAIHSGLLGQILSFLPVIPFLGMMLLIPRYLKREKDEFVRMLVLRALLWGFAVPMVVDTLLGFTWRNASLASLMPMLNIDLFFIAGMFALRFEGWRYQ